MRTSVGDPGLLGSAIQSKPQNQDVCSCVAREQSDQEPLPKNSSGCWGSGLRADRCSAQLGKTGAVIQQRALFSQPPLSQR